MLPKFIQGNLFPKLNTYMHTYQKLCKINNKMLIKKIDRERWKMRQKWIIMNQWRELLFFLIQAGSKTNNWFEIDTLIDLESHINVLKWKYFSSWIKATNMAWERKKINGYMQEISKQLINEYIFEKK